MLKHGLNKLLAEANAVIDTVSTHDALALAEDADVVLIDIRETAERQQQGVIPAAEHVPRGFLEFMVDAHSAMYNPVFGSGKKLLLFCASGGRSTLATKTLLDMGVARVAHIAGGFNAWREAGGQTREL